MERLDYYILEGTEIVKTNDVKEFAAFFETDNRRIDFTELPNGVHVSTVFLGIDHGYHSERPVLFETMILNGEHDNYMKRYCTYEEAKEGHQRAIKLVFE